MSHSCVANYQLALDEIRQFLSPFYYLKPWKYASILIEFKYILSFDAIYELEHRVYETRDWKH